MNNPAVLHDFKKGIATLTLNRPENKNALSEELVNALTDCLNQCINDSSVRVIVLTNTGSTFCAGADLKATARDKPMVSLVDLFERIQGATKPVVGKINGHCMGGGVGLAAACDISLVSDDVKLGFTEVRLGVAPAIISVVCLPKMNRADALQLFLSGERFSARKAQQVGLVNQVAPVGELDAQLDVLCDALVRGGPNALAASKQLVFDVPALSRSDAFKSTAELSMQLFNSNEAKEGISAFRERRNAKWVPD